MDKAGNLYGTTGQGGNVGLGTVFELSPNIAHTAYTETVLVHDLGGPYGGVLMDGTGTLYGTTVGGGTHGAGTVFRLSPNLNKTAWVRTVLYNFCAQPSCADGLNPYSALIMDAKGNLYGTVFDGGANHSGGVFQVTPNLGKTAWTYTLLYSFCSLSGCADGARSYASLLMDGFGTLYGTAYASGPNNVGLIFSLGPGSLCGTGGRMCASPLGAVPSGARLH
jgi:uncharacterized repeat protein (TIGR03803 family)